jgi:hypothetical protein
MLEYSEEKVNKQTNNKVSSEQYVQRYGHESSHGARTWRGWGWRQIGWWVEDGGVQWIVLIKRSSSALP